MPESTCNAFKKYCGIKTCESMLDLVILWVNGSDPNLQAKITLAKANSQILKTSGAKNRYRELGQLKYSFRSIEANFPLVRRIFLVTNNQVPSWLDTSHKQVRIVDHKTLGLHNVYNSMAIQSVVHRIPTLSSPYLYSEDDIYFGSEMRKQFLVAGTSAKIYVTQHVFRNAQDSYSKAVLKSKEMVESLGIDLSYIIDGNKVMYNSHVSMMMYVEEMNNIWKKFPKIMQRMVNHQFRDPKDPHLPSLYTFMQIGSNRTKLVKERKTGFFYLTEATYQDTLKLMVKYRKTPIICVNDDFHIDPSQEVLGEIDDTYKKLYPLKSKYEL